MSTITEPDRYTTMHHAQNFDNPTAAYRALANGRIQVLVDDSAMASWNINSVGEFRGMFTTQGKTFGQVLVGDRGCAF
jgi:ABC-type amino acid transport substrate-binding protein